MRTFDELFAIAAERKGGADALNALLVPPMARKALEELPDDRWLATLTKCVFQAGFSWKVIESKWDGFEAAFHGFDVGRCALMDDDWFDELITDTRIVRNGAKILSVRDNAVFIGELSKEHGSAGKFFANWPTADYIGLLDVLKNRGSRLGAATGQYAMRFAGMDGFILSNDVVGRLIAEGVIDKAPTSKKALAAVQVAFNEWQSQSSRSLKEISRVLAMSIG